MSLLHTYYLLTTVHILRLSTYVNTRICHHEFLEHCRQYRGCQCLANVHGNFLYRGWGGCPPLVRYDACNGILHRHETHLAGMRVVGSGLILVLDGRRRRLRLGDGVLVCYAHAPTVWLQHDGFVREDVDRRW